MKNQQAIKELTEMIEYLRNEWKEYRELLKQASNSLTQRNIKNMMAETERDGKAMVRALKELQAAN